VSLEVHRRFLSRFITAGDRVLEIGAGPGRFTLELVDIGARILVADFWPVQLNLKQTRLDGVTCVESWQLLDICNTSESADGEFDTVVAYGGPLSYAFENIDEALTGLFRSRDITELVERCGGKVLAISASHWASLDNPEVLA
jgi:ubiquinone/menaquinone biosynthesis C-methylase UbiE